MGAILMVIGGVSFIGYTAWLIYRFTQYDSKLPPLAGMLLSAVLVAGGLGAILELEAATNTSTQKPIVPSQAIARPQPDATQEATRNIRPVKPSEQSDTQIAENTPDKPAAPPENVEPKTQTPDSKDAVKGEIPSQKPHADYEITYQHSYVYKNVLGSVSCYVIVEVENTGNKNLYLRGASFDFEDKNGHLLSTYSTIVSSDPDIIAPGEKGYFYCNSAPLEGEITENSDYVLKPNLKIEEAKNDIVRYELSDLSISKGDYLSTAVVVGRVKNNTNEDDSLVWISCVLYRKDGTPIAAYGTNILDLAAGDTQSFKASSVYLADLGLDYSDIADYKVYACKQQYQF